nr:uncharacterized protein LOC109405535 [Aedes albopictus]
MVMLNTRAFTASAIWALCECVAPNKPLYRGFVYHLHSAHRGNLGGSSARQRRSRLYPRPSGTNPHQIVDHARKPRARRREQSGTTKRDRIGKSRHPPSLLEFPRRRSRDGHRKRQLGVSTASVILGDRGPPPAGGNPNFRLLVQSLFSVSYEYPKLSYMN